MKVVGRETYNIMGKDEEIDRGELNIKTCMDGKRCSHLHFLVLNLTPILYYLLQNRFFLYFLNFCLFFWLYGCGCISVYGKFYFNSFVSC